MNRYYEIHGDGQWLVLIAGLGADSSLFKPYTDRLAEKYKVLIFDNRGAGKTDKPDLPYSIPMMAEDTASLLEALGVEEAFLLGVSLGGRIAMEFTLQHPGTVRKLILVSAAPSVQTKLSVFPKIIKYVRSMRKSGQPYNAFIRQLNASAGYDCTERLKELNLPVLIAYGKKDRSVTQTQVAEMGEAIRGSRTIAFRGGHLFFLFRAEEFTNEILNFLL